MKIYAKLILAFFVISIFVAHSGPAIGAEAVKVKGFYIGMSIENALENFNRLGFEGLSVKEKKYRKTNTYYAISPGSGDPFKVETGMNVKTVSKLYFSPGISDRLFGTTGINSEIFKNAFITAYGNLTMAPYKDNPGTENIRGWEHYNLTEGYRIRIDLKKAVEIIKTAKESDFSFD